MFNVELYDKQWLLDYKGHTISTLLDRVDDDWSWVVKKGHYETHQDMHRQDGRFVSCGINLPSREAAVAAAKAFVDGLSK